MMTKTLTATLLILCASIGFADLTVQTVQGVTEIKGVLNGPLVLDGAKDVKIDVTGTFPIAIYRSSDIEVKANIQFAGRPIYIENSKRITTKDSVFDAMGADADAAMVSGAFKYHTPGAYSFTPYDSIWGVAWDSSKLTFGEPAIVDQKPNWIWSKTNSVRTGQEMWHGYDPNTYSQEIKFINCKFLNAKRAGLFIHHTRGYLVENCIADRGSVESNEYGIGAEWTVDGVIRNCTVQQQGIWTHYQAENILIDSCTVPTGMIQVMSQGEPVRNVTVNNSSARALRFWNGQFSNFNRAAWMERIRVNGGTYECVWVASGQVENQLPELMISDFELRGVTVNRLATSVLPVPVRLESVNGYRIANCTINGGPVQDFSAGMRLPSVQK